MSFKFTDEIEIVPTQGLYNWAHIWGRVQKRYYRDQVHLRREKQIKDFIALNEFANVYLEKDTDVFDDMPTVANIEQADIVVITDQKFSRLPCPALIQHIQHLSSQCQHLLICLNRHYINIDDSYHDPELSDNFNLAVAQWLRKQLVHHRVLDLSLDYLDRGDWFTWVIPDRIFYIERTCA